MKRKIAAILAADIAGFSKLVAEDEEGALERLGSARDHFVTSIDQYGGRVFNEAGDSILAEFQSAVDALRCAVEVQQHSRTLSRDEPRDRRMLYRIGLTIGDVVERDGNLLGDAVNVAARLESLAKPGGICISRSVHEHVSGKIAVRFLSLGEQKLKNIPARQHAYEVILPQLKSERTEAAARALDPPPITARAGSLSPATKRLAAGLAIAVCAGVAAWALPWHRLAAPFATPAATVAATPRPTPTATAKASEPSVERPAGKPASQAADPAATIAAPAPAGPSTPTSGPAPVPASPTHCSTFLPQTGTTISIPCPDAPAPAPTPAATIARPAAAPHAAPEAPASVAITLPTRRPADLSPPAPPPALPPAITTPAPEPAKADGQRAISRRKGQHCAEILERAQLGELSADDRDYLQRACR